MIPIKEPLVLTVSQINSYLKAYIDENERLKGIYIKGEISDYKGNYFSGHLYFSLKDEQSEIRCVMFRSYAERIKFVPENGMAVILRGDLTVYQKSGSTQLCVYDMEPEGLGAKYLAFIQLKEKLQKEGLFAEGNKKPLPRYPMRIGVVTSAQGAAIHDIENVLSRRWPIAEIILAPAAVQGESAPRELKEALLKQENEIKPDLIIIGRGGGSTDDLSAFNDEELARTIFRCNTPIISAVGHEIDFSITDFVADLRAPTPSAAAELAAPDINELAQNLDANESWLRETILKKLDYFQFRLDNISGKRFLAVTQSKIDYLEKVTDEKSGMLRNRFGLLIEKKKGILAECAAKLDAYSPVKMLMKTSCIVEKDGKSLKSVNDLSVNDSIELNFTDGMAAAVVTDLEKRSLEI